MVVIMTDLQDFCQEPRSMDELVEAGYKPTNVYNAVKRKELTNTKATDDWGRSCMVRVCSCPQSPLRQ
jgi:hypothetical protein